MRPPRGSSSPAFNARPARPVTSIPSPISASNVLSAAGESTPSLPVVSEWVATASRQSSRWHRVAHPRAAAFAAAVSSTTSSAKEGPGESSVRAERIFLPASSTKTVGGLCSLTRPQLTSELTSSVGSLPLANNWSCSTLERDSDSRAFCWFSGESRACAKSPSDVH